MKRSVSTLTFLLAVKVLNIFSYTEAAWEKLNIDVRYLNTLETTPRGIIAGEMDSRISLDPYNGVYFSTDLGRTWSVIGLRGRGIVDLDYYNNKIYAATYYVQNNQRGLFFSENLGETWHQMGPMYSPTCIDINNNCIFMGTEHRSLQVSCDEGQTWEQKLPDETKIKNVAAFKNIVLASGISRVYRSLDNGLSWENIGYFNNSDFIGAAQIENILFLGNSSGLYRSADKGLNWEKITNHKVTCLNSIKNKLIMSVTNPASFTTDVLISKNFGDSWENLDINLHQQYKILDLSKVFGEEYHILALSLTQGIHKFELRENPEQNPFMDPPWNLANSNDLTDKITAYFDHQYPLLGYGYHREPSEENDSTLNYLGKKEKIPELYYSSHSGTDFGLKLGTEIIAPAPGYARYYYCTDCGHSIKIDHLNGYQTTYMHLQKENILTLDSYNPVWVGTGDVLGKVGMTGNTTGPHLHFEVLENSIFPDGRSDPFGWQVDTGDPWEEYFWTDTLGQHTGTASKNLWNQNIPYIKSFNYQNTTHVLDNKTFEYSPLYGCTIEIFPRGNPTSLVYDPKISYIPNTAFYLNIYDQNSNPIAEDNVCTEITINLENINIPNVLMNSLSFYHYSNETGLWNKISSILNLAANFIRAQTCEYSLFSVFGEKIDSEYPLTSLESVPPLSVNWFNTYPLVSMGSEDPEASMFYKLSYKKDWELYEGPFEITKNGIIQLLYRGKDPAENLEPTKSQIFKINTTNKVTDKIKVKGAIFEIN